MLLTSLASLAVVGLAFGLWFWWACAVPTSTFFRPALIRGPEEGKRICLTFDDGPASPFTEQVLAILRGYQVPATFFVCGKNVERDPDLVRRIVAEGHAVGNHTYSHPFVLFKSRQRIAEEIDRTQEVLEKVAGHRPRIFRPPYGARWFGLVPTLLERGMHLVLWSATGYDWKNDVPGIVAATMKNLKPGAVILLHDGRETRWAARVDRSRTVEALPGIIAGARQRGYTFVPLQEFLPAT
jgi:peptidoglycan/xylan/chitin deacetylase (PgdA/CDA1 family)